MRTSLRPYPEYRNSGLPWLGRIPAHWQVRRNGYLFAQRNETGYGELPILEVSLNTGVRVRDFDGTARKQVMSDREKYKRAAQGDITYNMMRLWQGAVGVAPKDGLVSPAYVVARPHPGTVSPYYVELFRTDAYKEEIGKYSRGIVSDRNRLYWDEFKQMPVCVPPPDEQAAIVRCLDHADQKIRRFIHAKRRLIELLNEQRQEIIHKAVTRGLDPDVRLRPSHVEWIGDIPEHWQMVALRRLVTPGRRITYGIVQPGDPDPNGSYMVRGKDYSSGWCAAAEIFRVSGVIELSYKRSRLLPNDLVITIVGAGVGNVAVVPSWLSGANITQTTARIAVDPSKAEPNFVSTVLQGPIGRRNVDAFVYGSAQPRLNLPHVAAFVIPLPPIDEQRDILRFLDRETASYTPARVQALREIELIKEYRTRLIADVVTGKLDVREAAKRLPSSIDQAADDESLGLSALDPEQADGSDDDPELLPVAADED